MSRPMAGRDRTALTYRYERWRAVTNGMLETAGTTFLLLIAVKWFKSGATAKALVAGGGSTGLLLTPLVVSLVQGAGWPVAKAASCLAAGGAACFLIMALAPWLPVFVIGSVVSMAASSAAIPLMTQVYQENYPEKQRGRFFSRTVMIRIGVAALFSELAGRALSAHVEKFRWLLLVFAGAFACSSFCLSRCPSQPLTASDGSHPFRALRYARRDRLFRQTLICWMLMGFADLMMLPMRVEYLANPKYGLALCVSVNLGFAAGILAFFTSNSVAGLILGSVVFGISNAGGDVAWGLWVTKFAPPARVADYMAVHTFFTGMRGVLAPLLAFHLVSVLGVETLGWASVALIVLASLLLVPEFKFGRRARPSAALIEEVSE